MDRVRMIRSRGVNFFGVFSSSTDVFNSYLSMIRGHHKIMLCGSYKDLTFR